MTSAAGSQAARLDRYWRRWQNESGFRSEVSMIGASTLRTQYRVSDIVGWQREGTLQLNPAFQRRPVWKKGAKSYFIDTLIKGFPVPIIFVRDMPSDIHTLKSRRDVVDGQQRIRTILSFIDHTLLPDWNLDRDVFAIQKNHNKDLAGKTFEELSQDDKQKILDYQFSVHSFPADTNDRLILQIFARMNATGYKLNDQELRNAEFYGEFKTLSYELATEQLERWKHWRIFNNDQIARMTEVELTSEFLMLISHGVLGKSKKRIDSFYSKYEDTFPDQKESARRYRAVFDSIESVIGPKDIAKYFSTRTMFYALFSTIYDLQFGIRVSIQLPREPQHLVMKKAEPIKAAALEHLLSSASRIKEGDVPPEVLKAARGATTDASQRTIIIGFIAGKDNNLCLPQR